MIFDEQEDYENLVFFRDFSKLLGILKPETSRVIDEYCEQYERRQALIGQALAQGIREDIQNNFKDGVVLGLCRIACYTAGCFFSPILLKKVLAPVSGMLTKVKALAPAALTRLKKVNSVRKLKLQEIYTEFMPVLEPLAEQGKLPAGITPEGFAANFVFEEEAAGFAGVAKKTIAPGVLQDANGVIEVANMHSFFDHVPFGQELKGKCRRLKKFWGNERMYEVTEKVPGTSLDKGDIFYLDPGKEKNHIEVYTGRCKAKDVINLDGTVNVAKRDAALKQGRKIKL
jgi:hypothetical protein